MVEINNLTNFKINEARLKRTAGVIFKKEKKGLKSDISVAFVGKKEIKAFNKKYRKKNKPTDVLSFIYFNSKKILSGEVIICPKIVEENAKQSGYDFKLEIMKVLIHGILHLLGYDHEKSRKGATRMENRQNYYLSKLSIH